MAPIRIDGTDITGATIDGTDVTEITVDGDTVFTAGPPIPQNGLQYWYSASQETAANNSTITTLTDFSGNARDASYDSTNSPPIFKSSGGVQNNQPYYEFSRGGMRVSNSFNSLSAYEFYIVYSNDNDPPSTSDAGYQFGLNDDNGQNAPWLTGPVFLSVGNTGRWISKTINDTTGENMLYFIGDGSNNIFNQSTNSSDNQFETNSQSTYDFDSEFVISGDPRGVNSRGLQGEFYEFIFYDRNLTSTERTQLRNFLSSTYNLVL